MRLLAATAAFVAVLALTPAHATDWSIPPDAIANSSCDQSAEVATYSCVEKAYVKADAELNQVWKEVLASISMRATDNDAKAEDWTADLVAAQKAWNEFKDKDCNGARSYEYWGGSARSLAVLSCLYVYTVTRTEDLKARYLEN